MDSEAETDTPDVKPIVRTPTVAERKKNARRDPNEEIPLNWQRKLHLADRMPALDLSEGFEIEEGIRLVAKSQDSLQYSVGDYVFVTCEFSAAEPHLPEDIGASPQAFRIARIMEFKVAEAKVNWLVRPDDVMYRSRDSRELYITFQTSWVNCQTFRGKCVVMPVQEIKVLSRFRVRPCQFWFAHLYDQITRRLWDVAILSVMKNLGSRTVNELSRVVNLVILKPGKAKQIGDLNRKRKLPDDQGEEEPISEEELEELAKQKLQWPFRYFDYENRELSEPTVLPELRSKNAHVEVDEWPGQPLRFYTEVIAPSRSRKRTAKFRLVEIPNAGSIPGLEEDVDDIEPFKKDKPWLQKMPQGYIPRGEDSTSIPVSLPSEGLSEFVSKCRTNYADSLEVRPSSVNFLDACCAIYISNSENIDDAFVTVSRLSRKLLREPDMSVAELSKFKTELNPFARNSWHQAFKAVGDKPIVELCHYYWVDYPLQAMVQPTQLFWDGKDHTPETEEDDSEFETVCAICSTTSSPEWKSLPGYVPLLHRPDLADAKLVALCARCAKLWYRYKVKWISPSKLMNRIEQLEQSSEYEPELLGDTRAYMTERDRRSKRRAAASEKKEATAKKREEIKVLKKAAKEAKKSGVEVPIELERQLAEKTQASKATTPVPEKQKIQSKPDREESKLKKQRSDPNVEVKKADNTASPESVDDSTQTTPKKRAPPSVNQLSLDQVEQMLDDLDMQLEPAAARVANYCVVCGQLDPSMPHVVCASCGLNAHTACYGMQSIYSMESEPNKVWICDCCENSRGAQIADTNYQCKLCSTRGPVYASWLSGQKTSAPDALKNTTEKSWCHLRCAIWTPGVSFGDTTQYRDIDTSHVDKEVWNSLCEICMENGRQPKALSLPALANYSSASQANTKTNLEAASTQTEEGTSNRPAVSNGSQSSDATLTNNARWANTVPPNQLAAMGTTVKCDLCRHKFHVSCAADKGYKLGFTKGNNPSPIIVCSKHSGTDLVPMSRIDMNMNMTVLQMHISRNRGSNVQHMSPVDMLVKLEKEDVLLTQDLEPVPTVFPLSTNIERLKHFRGRLKCDQCGNEAASYWHARDEDNLETPPPDTPDAVLCPLCYRGMNPVGTGNDEAEANGLASQLCENAFDFYSQAVYSQRVVH